MTIYLDNASTSFPKPESVYRRMTEFLRESGANPGRAGHKMAVQAEREIDLVRLKIARLIGAKEPRQVVFTLNGTDALNIAIKGIVKEGDHVITSTLEHNSVSRPLEQLRVNNVVSVNKVGFDSSGQIDPDDIRNAIQPTTRLIILTHASNVIGTIQPVTEIGEIARNHNLLFLVDAAQTAGCLQIDIERSNIDLLAAPGHKSLLGPPGTGFLYVGPRAAEVIRPIREGGTGGDSASKLQPEEFPFRLEGGTPNTSGIAGLGAGIDFIDGRGLEQIRQYDQSLISTVLNRLTEMEGVTVYPNNLSSDRVGVASFNVKGFSPAELGNILDESFDIAVRTGLHCAPYLHQSIGTFPEGSVRASVNPLSTAEDVNALCNAIDEILKS
ncbi:MAG TPA: aminotransferase class V-fold PLP-dependent enzyme [Blastocatellia bacterium]|nr:aminotransferase class V-fold PLP-dependent enzyme [Blastocatellia bacterium]